MDIGSLLVIFSIAILAGLNVASPFFSDTFPGTESEPGEGDINRQERDLLRLLEEKDSVLNELQELDTDSYLGKVAPEEYPHLRDSLKAYAAAVLQKIADLEEHLQEEHEKAPDYLREPELPASNGRDVIEEMIAARRLTRNEKSAGFCPKCGKAVRKSDVYCPSCGSKVG